MNTTIDNNQRVFQIVTSTGKQVFCNLNQLNQVCKGLDVHQGYFKLNHFWNNKAERVTKKLLSDMFKAHGIKQEFFY